MNNYPKPFSDFPLFRCKWVKLTGGGVEVDKKYGMTTVDLHNLMKVDKNLDEPFVLANDVAQVFYVKDISTKPRKIKNKKKNTSDDEPKCHIVLLGKRNIVEWRTRQTCQKIVISFMKFRPSR